MVRSRSFRFGVFCVAALLLMAGQLARAQQGTIRGTVVDSGGKPIRDAAVFVTSARQTARTDDRGRFTLDRLPLGEVELSVRSIGYFPNKTSVVAGQGADSVRAPALTARFAGLGMKLSVGAWLTGLTTTVKVRVIELTPPLAVPPESVTVTVTVAWPLALATGV